MSIEITYSSITLKKYKEMNSVCQIKSEGGLLGLISAIIASFSIFKRKAYGFYDLSYFTLLIFQAFYG